MPRLPLPGGDQGTWGQILNDYLAVEHDNNGTLKNVARPSQLAAKADASALAAKADVSALEELATSTELDDETARASAEEQAIANTVGISLGVVFKQGASWPQRPTGFSSVLWIGAAPGPTIGGVGNAVDGADLWDEI